MSIRCSSSCLFVFASGVGFNKRSGSLTLCEALATDQREKGERKGKCSSEKGGKHNTEGMLCLRAMPLEQRSLGLKIPASHRTARERGPLNRTTRRLQGNYCAYSLQVFIISSQLVINQSVCVVSRKPVTTGGYLKIQ